MTEERVQVRLIPKDADGRAESWDFHVPPGYGRNRFLPDPARAVVALTQMLGRGLPSFLTQNDTLKAAVNIDLVESTFKTKITRDDSGRFKPVSELIIPEWLRDTVAFAYIPTPMEYYSPSLVPPKADTFHLTLDDVAYTVGATVCHEAGLKGQGVTVATIDTGLANHPYFEERGYKLKAMKDSPGGDASVDEDGHGTATAANVFAVAPECMVMGVKGLAAEGLEYCIANQVNVINCSWGWDIDYVDLMTFHEENPNLYWELVDVERLVRKAHQAGIPVLFAAGNGGHVAPSCLPEAIAVGGTSITPRGYLGASNLASAFESHFYPGRNVPDLCGVMARVGKDGIEGHIMSPVPKDSTHDGMNLPEMSGWSLCSGTSAATPQVAGVVALMLGSCPTLTPHQVKEVLMSTCVDVVTGSSATAHKAVPGVDLATGTGLVCAPRACNEGFELTKQG